ncbi:response regulator transcription factor [Asticcacaulis sp. AND118]|uniref:response regulator transcription factor n=1 Tax=Asticcacaulis sp. AND118 TaxID=2840468 RepID=UPI001CFFEB6C|nr:response regulator transcription factor [Asticcacaulis sp. AND118]UDF05182.1 response regulator transcription factor [Asticcacaulis sp. AND118]
MSESILIADDHPLFRQALTMAARKVRPGAEIIEAGTLDTALEAVRGAQNLSLTLLDLKMPGAEGFSGVALLHAEAPEVPILVVSAAEAEKAAREARRFGAVGFIGKDQSLPHMQQAILDALEGRFAETAPEDEAVDTVAAKVADLTPTQLRVLLGVLAGRLNKQIAFDLSISEATVKAHMTAIMRKLDVHNRTQAVLAAKALGIGA